MDILDSVMDTLRMVRDLDTLRMVRDLDITAMVRDLGTQAMDIAHQITEGAAAIK